LLACAAAAYGLSRFRAWVAVLTLLVVAGGFTGSTVIHTLCHPDALNPAWSIDVSNDWNDPKLNEFSGILMQDPPGISFRVFAPGAYIYYSEFHATQGGHFLTLLTLFAAIEALRRKRSLWPWIFLLLSPVLTIVTCTWFFFIIVFVAGPTLLLAWWIGRRPANWRYVVAGVVGGGLLLWPTLDDFMANSLNQPLYWANLKGDRWMILIQWWPIYLPWLLLGFAWPRLTLTARWLHFLIVPIFVFTELFYFTERQTCLEKTWGGVFGLGMAVLYPSLFVQRGAAFRALTGLIVVMAMISGCIWTWSVWSSTNMDTGFMHLQGDSFLRADPQCQRLEQTLGRIRAKTVLTGRSRNAFFESPSLAAFTENRAFLGWTNAEETTGNAEEAHARSQASNDFYDGKMASPLAFLQANAISAVVIWPEDKCPDEFIAKLKSQLDPAFTYFDCKGTGEDNAGVFLQSDAAGR
jgi:hypothetical protein